MEQPSTPDNADSPVDESVPVEFIGHGGEHGLGREMLCSLPRSVSCRLCKGEHDCPYIVDRPYGRLIVKKRKPQTVLAQRVIHKQTGIRNREHFHSPIWQPALAIFAWIAIPVAAWFTWIVHPLTWSAIAIPASVLLATLAMTVIGVPLVRLLWRDRGGRRRGGAWKPS